MCPLPAPLALLPDIGSGEMMLLLFVVLLLFGGDKMPQLAKGLARAVRDFRRAAGDVEREIKRAIDEVPDKPTLPTIPKEILNPLSAQPPTPRPPAAPPAAAPNDPPKP